MYIVTSFIRDYNTEIILGMAALSLILLIFNVSLSIKLSRVTKRRNARLENGQVGDLVDSITGLSNAVQVVQDKINEISIRQDEQGRTLDLCVKRVGLVKFDAFEDVGGEQSFAVAFMDSHDNGVILSSLYGRQDSRTYIKGITNGAGERELSEDEQRALKAARGSAV
ncbi:MAG: DUF4446 family protein [Armatimonadetes bacterium]|nr:DUF4446 family protein [Armatimonadota bacterium]